MVDITTHGCFIESNMGFSHRIPNIWINTDTAKHDSIFYARNGVAKLEGFPRENHYRQTSTRSQRNKTRVLSKVLQDWSWRYNTLLPDMGSSMGNNGKIMGILWDFRCRKWWVWSVLAIKHQVTGMFLVLLCWSAARCLIFNILPYFAHSNTWYIGIFCQLNNSWYIGIFWQY